MTKTVNNSAAPTTTQAAALAFANATVQSLDALAKRRETWEATDFKKANDGLYSLLADCYAVYDEKFEKAGDSDKTAVRVDLKGRLQAAGVKVQVNTTTLTMMVRFVFGSDRKRAHGYTYVIKAAISHDIAPSELSDWIKTSGGIEEIKRKSVISDQALQNREKRQAALDEVKASAETAVINPIGEVHFDQTIVLGKHAVLVVQPNANGTAHIVAVLPEADDPVIEALYKRIARGNLKTQAEAEARAKEAAVNAPVGKQPATDGEKSAANADQQKLAA